MHTPPSHLPKRLWRANLLCGHQPASLLLVRWPHFASDLQSGYLVQLLSIEKQLVSNQSLWQTISYKLNHHCTNSSGWAKSWRCEFPSANLMQKLLLFILGKNWGRKTESSNPVIKFFFNAARSGPLSLYHACFNRTAIPAHYRPQSYSNSWLNHLPLPLNCGDVQKYGHLTKTQKESNTFHALSHSLSLSFLPLSLLCSFSMCLSKWRFDTGDL